MNEDDRQKIAYIKTKQGGYYLGDNNQIAFSMEDDPMDKFWYLKTAHWKYIRSKVMQRDHYACKLCNSKKKLQVHHRTYSHIGHERQHDLITLCDSCHEYIHDKVVIT